VDVDEGDIESEWDVLLELRFPLGLSIFLDRNCPSEARSAALKSSCRGEAGLGIGTLIMYFVLDKTAASCGDSVRFEHNSASSRGLLQRSSRNWRGNLEFDELKESFVDSIA